MKKKSGRKLVENLMRIELITDGSAKLYSSTGHLIGHFANVETAKAWAKGAYGKDVPVDKKEVNESAESPSGALER